MTRSSRAARLFLCAGACLVPLVFGGAASASGNPDGWGRTSYTSHATKYAGWLSFNGHRYGIACSDRSLYDIGGVFHRYGYSYSVHNGELTIRIGSRQRCPSIGWSSDLHRASIAYRGDCIVIKLYDTVRHSHASPRHYDTHQGHDRYYNERRYDTRRYERRRYQPRRRYYRPSRPSRCW